MNWVETVCVIFGIWLLLTNSKPFDNDKAIKHIEYFFSQILYLCMVLVPMYFRFWRR